MKEQIKEKLDAHDFPPMAYDLLHIDGCVLAGGSILDICLGRTPNDYDFFFTSDAAIVSARSLFESRERIETAYTTTFGKIQLIHKQAYESENAIISDFDFAPIQMAYSGDKLFIGEKTADCINSKEVVVNVITCPYESMGRLRKFWRMGYDIKPAYDYIASVLHDKGSVCVVKEFYE